MNFYFAPVQGHTDAAYRHFHSKIYDCRNFVEYTTPFVRLEKGEIRKKDHKDIFSELNSGINVVPQIIFKNQEELIRLVELLKAGGCSRIDLNMGCPFPLQTARGRGGATIANPECHQAVKKVVEENPEINFSVKIRLGMKDAEWTPLIDTLNSVSLDHLTVHPRRVSDQYSGPVDLEEFGKIYNISSNPIVYNGDIRTVDDAERIISEFPEIKGLMIGRGALGRPSLFKEILEKREWKEDERRTYLLAFHRELINHYVENLIGGEHQILSKIQPFWEFSEDEIGRKAWKSLKKASSIAKYQTALTLV